MNEHVRQLVIRLSTFGLLAVALVLFQPSVALTAAYIGRPYAWVATVGTDRAIGTAAGALLWLAALWMAIGLSAAVWVERTGRTNRILVSLARSTPKSLRRLVLTSVGMSLVLSPATAFAASSGQPTASTPVTHSMPRWPADANPQPAAENLDPSAVPAPSWPTSPTQVVEPANPTPSITTSPQSSSGSGTSTPAAPLWPVTPASPSDTVAPPTTAPAGSAGPSSAPAIVVPAPGYPTLPTLPTINTPTSTPAPKAPNQTTPTLTPSQPAPHPTTPAPPTPPQTAAPAPETVTVQAGDSLWAITAQRLGPSASEAEIAIEWPYWYRANHRVIGSDPGLLRAGQRLVVPSNQKGRS